MDRTRQLSARGGILMPVTIVIASLVFLLALWATRFQARHQFLVRGLEQSWQADEAARAGLEVALREMKAERSPELQKALGPAQVTVSEVVPGRDRPDGVLHLRSRAIVERLSSVEEALVRRPQILLSEDFDGLLSGWAPLAAVGLGYYVLDFNLGATYSLAGDPGWSDYVAEFDALLSQGLGLGLLVRATPEAGGYEGYRVRWTALPPQVTLARVSPAGEVILAQQISSLDLSLTHRYRVRVRGDRIEVEIDGNPIFDVIDPQPLPGGGIGIEPALGSLVLLDRVEVRSEFEVMSRWQP